MLERLETKSFCPSTTSAAWLLELGIVFQISTRFSKLSAMNRRVPSLDTEAGASSELAVVLGRYWLWMSLMKSDWPSTNVAAWPLPVIGP